MFHGEFGIAGSQLLVIEKFNLQNRQIAKSSISMQILVGYCGSVVPHIGVSFPHASQLDGFDMV